MHKSGIAGKSLLMVAALAALASIANADSVADFYKNRSISMIIGYSVGGGYDASWHTISAGTFRASLRSCRSR